MKTLNTLSTIRWDQVEAIVKDSSFLANIQSMDDEKLKASFEPFGIRPTDEETAEFRRFFTKVITSKEELTEGRARYTQEYIKKLLNDEELNNTTGGSVLSHIVAFVAGVAATCLVVGIPAKVLLDQSEKKYNELKESLPKLGPTT